jgi:hypothetical protein
MVRGLPRKRLAALVCSQHRVRSKLELRQVCTAADRPRRVGRRAPAAAEAAPVCAPVTADTRRHSAAQDDRGSGAERHVAMASDTTRHAGVGLQHRRVPVRFLSHLPFLVLETKGLHASKR